MMDDLITRQAAIDAVEESRRFNPHEDSKVARNHEYEHRHFLKILHELPLVQPEIKTGQWEYVDYGGVGNYHCTACGKICICNGDYDFCPSCGAKMLKDGESDDS